MMWKQFLIVIYIIQIIISTAFIFWGWKINLNLSELLTWLMFEITGVIAVFEWFRRLDNNYIRKERERNKRREELNGSLNRHSGELINEVLRKWFAPNKNIHNVLTDSYIVAQTPTDVIIYRLCFKSEVKKYIDLCIEKRLLKYSDEAKEHLKVYSKSIEWINYEELSNKCFKDVIEICNSIEKKVITNIPSDFTECSKEINIPNNGYILDKTVNAIYRNAVRITERGHPFRLFKKVSEHDCFKVVDSDSRLYVQSIDEGLIDKFMNLVDKIAIDTAKTEEKRIGLFKSRNERMRNEFQNIIDKIIDDFERENRLLKGTCRRCKVWYDELESFK